MYKFTVFTATYNRAHTLERVYNSLKAQVFRDFEWLIVDDGSTDGTREVVACWQQMSGFPIRFLRQENQGKHIAFNRGVEEAKGELFLTLDSDDECVPEALDRFYYHWDCIPAENRAHFSAVTALCVDQDGNIIGDKFPQNPLDSDPLEIRYRFNVRGEKWGFHRTDVLKRFMFPDLDGTRFVPEGVVWSAIATQFKTRYVNEPLRVYWINRSVDSDQLTRSCIPSKHAVGHAFWHQSILNDEITWFSYAPAQFLRSAVHYARFSLHAGVSMGTQLNKLTNWKARCLWFAALPMGLLVYGRDLNGFRTNADAGSHAKPSTY